MSQVSDTKQCPECAEEVRAAARVCRFCGYRFDEEGAAAPPAGEASASPAGQPPVGTRRRSTAPDQQLLATATAPRKRRGLVIALVVLGCIVVAIVAAGAFAYMSRKSLTDEEMGYTRQFVREDYKETEYYTIGTALAMDREAAYLRGREPTAAARAKAQRLFREGDAYYKRLQALDSPSELFDETHAAWHREVDLQRRALAAVRAWYSDPWGDRGRAGSRTASRLAKRATTAGDAAWKLFVAVVSEEASSDQITQINQLQDKYSRQLKQG